jgi:hypothetical protein
MALTSMNTVYHADTWLKRGLCLLLAAVPVQAADWSLVHESGPLKVERRPYQGSSLAELRGVTTVNSTLNGLMALLRDAPRNAEWVYRSGGARILEQEAYRYAWVYGVVDAPLPLRDRDTVVRFDYRQDPATGVIDIGITNFPDFVPRVPGLVRVPDFGGFWRLRPLGDGRVEVTYQVRGDPGGWIPVWLANYAAEVSVIRTLENLPAMLPAYQDALAPGVEEPAPASPPD